jgi:hypothetical protein
MSDTDRPLPDAIPSARDILALQQAQKHQEIAQAKEEEEAARRWHEVVAAFHAVRYCTKESLPAGTDFYTEFANRLTSLANLLFERGELDPLIKRVGDVSKVERELDRHARLFVVNLLHAARDGHVHEVAQHLRQVIGLPFEALVGEWLRRDLERVFLGAYPLTGGVDGIIWPILRPVEFEADPNATFLEACDSVSRGLEERGRKSSGSIDFANVIRKFWLQVEELADRLHLPHSPTPCSVLTVDDALREVDRVRKWARRSNEILRDAPLEMVAKFPLPAAGRFVIDNEDCLTLVWEDSGKRVSRPTDGLLVRGGQEAASWLPVGWTMDVYPAGWTRRASCN